MSTGTYMLAGQSSELDRLQLQSRVWEPAGRRLLEEIGDGCGKRVVDVGCGAMGWLRLLSEWVGRGGQVVGTDIDGAMLAAADKFVAANGLRNVVLLEDDVFESELETSSFDLVHARFLLTPIGHSEAQLATFARLVRPGGTVALEEPDATVPAWHYNPRAPALERLVELILDAFKRWGDDEAGCKQLELLRDVGIEGRVRAEVIALPPGHPYLQLPLQLATGLEARLRELVAADQLVRLRRDAEEELRRPERWATTFTLLQSWGSVA
jgi:SAM-dependent methyltransferase